MIPFDKIYVINLERRADRWQKIKRECENAGLQVERFPAIDGNEIKAEVTGKKGVVGCLLSHMSILGRADMMGFDYIMVLEDDAQLAPNFISRLQAASEDLPEDWDMLYLGAGHKMEPEVITDRIFRVTKAFTTHAYIMRSTMFKKVFYQMRPFNHEDFQPIDCVYVELQREGNCYVVNPPLAWQEEGFSDIEGRNMGYEWLKTNQAT